MARLYPALLTIRPRWLILLFLKILKVQIMHDIDISSTLLRCSYGIGGAAPALPGSLVFERFPACSTDVPQQHR